MHIQPVKPTYTATLSQSEVHILESLVGNTAGDTFHGRISGMYRELHTVATRHNPHTLVVDGATFRTTNTLSYERETS